MTTEQTQQTEEELAAQEEAEFQAGFEDDGDAAATEAAAGEAEEPGDDPKGGDDAEEDDEPGDDPEKPDDEDEDEPKGEDPKSAVTADLTEDDKLEMRLRRVEGRIGSISRDVNTILSSQEELKSAMTAAKDIKATGDDAPTRDQVKDALQSGEKMAELKKEFPEWAEAMEEERERTIAHVTSNMVSKEDAERMAKERATAARDEARALARLDSRHEGWEDKVKEPEFVAWVLADEKRKALAYSEYVSDSLKLLDDWKTEQENKPDGKDRSNEDRRQKSESRLRDAVPATTGGATRQERAPSEEEDFLAGFNGR